MLRKRFHTATGLGIISVALGILGSSLPAYADEPVLVDNPSYVNYYAIHNVSGETLTFVPNSIGQYEEDSSCVGITCTAYSEGFADVVPPQIIHPGETVYFGIPAFVYQGHTYDKTDMKYTNEDGMVFHLQANRHIQWKLGLMKSTDDDQPEGSSCETQGSKTAYRCELKEEIIHRRLLNQAGTAFIYHGPNS